MSKPETPLLDAANWRHPLQRFHSPSRGLSSILHIIGLSSFVASFKHLVDYPSLANDSFGWHFQYLTIVGLSLATLTFIVGLTADVTLSRRLFAAKNTLSFCSAPLEILISILYWGLRAIDEKLVIPEWMELDPWADIGFHAVPAIFLAIDLLFLSPPWTFGALPAVGISGFLAFAYWTWIEVCYSYNGWYPYPIFTLLAPAQRVVLFVGSAILMTMSSILLKLAYHRLNGRQLDGARA